MLGNKDTMATVAVRDLKAAKKFYEGTIGLELLDTEGEEALTYASGSSRLLVYRSPHAGSNEATAATWLVGDDIDEIVQALRARGVAFEHYDMPGMTLKGDVHVAANMRAAWFKDPDGNIHALVSG
ncbi:MAG: VOC family protein [Candidatus Polarisedimenticolia bacterium]